MKKPGVIPRLFLFPLPGATEIYLQTANKYGNVLSWRNGMETVREKLQVFVRRFGLLNAACCDECCGEQVSPVQSHILFEIRRMGNPSMQQVADELGMDITTFSRQVKTVEGKGLVERRVAPEDRRVSLLGLTSEGERVLGEIDRFMAVKIGEIFSFMTQFEREAVISTLGLLNEAVAKAGGCCSPAKEKVAGCK
jgi:DNA-binding MarR family transcriptional regulator